jgi:hypothetical protein
MHRQIRRTIALAAAAVALVSVSAFAQGKGHGKEKDKEKDKSRRGDEIVRVDGRDGRGNGSLPPGLAKKPGGMPPGQYKKLYPSQGATALRTVLTRRGYTVVRTTPYGQSQYVYYRLPNGTTQRAIVSPGTQRLQFSNVPQSLLQEVLGLLY